MNGIQEVDGSIPFSSTTLEAFPLLTYTDPALSDDLEETPENCHTLKLPHPILTNRDLEKLRRVSRGDLLAITLPALFRAGGATGVLTRLQLEPSKVQVSPRFVVASKPPNSTIFLLTGSYAIDG